MHHAPSPAAPAPARLDGVDALRGVAAIAVCLFHWETIAFGTPVRDQLFHFGLLGVELFFMISGFVILMVAERARSVSSFLLARIVRLYPAYLASVILTAVYVLTVGKYDLATVLVNVTMLQSFVDVPNITNPYWTLAFEITFYLLFAAVLAARALARVEALVLAWLGIALLYRLAVPGPLGFDAARPLAQLGYVIVAPQFAPFFVLGLMVHRLRSGRLGHTGQVAIAVALGLTLRGRDDFAAVPGPAYALAACTMTAGLWMASRWETRGMAGRAMAWLGLVSYPLYLVHCTVANLCVTALSGWGGPALLAVALSVPLSLALAAGLHHGLERPLASAFRRAAARRSTPAPDPLSPATSRPAHAASHA